MKNSKDCGFTMIELIVTLTIMGVLALIAIPAWRSLSSSSSDSATALVSHFKVVRAKALANTMAYKIYPSSTTQINVDSAANCSASTWTNDASLRFTLSDGSALSSTAWSFCYDSRGLSSNSLTFNITATSKPTITIEAVLGGAVRQL